MNATIDTVVALEAFSTEDAVVLKEKITDKLHNFIIAENYEAVFSISIGVINAATFCEGTEECLIFISCCLIS